MTALFPCLCTSENLTTKFSDSKDVGFFFCAPTSPRTPLHPSSKEGQFFIQAVQVTGSVVLILHFWVFMMPAPVGKVHWIWIRDKRSTLVYWKRAGWKLHFVFPFFHFLKIEWNLSGDLKLENITARMGGAEMKGYILYSHPSYIFTEQGKRRVRGRRSKCFLLDYFL